MPTLGACVIDAFILNSYHMYVVDSSHQIMYLSNIGMALIMHLEGVHTLAFHTAICQFSLNTTVAHQI